ncbi:MAG TPA: AsmA family protein [Povalibacter sp.]|uniref:AsmA family protein n=1 Tax=Povalibacter sp. TaxID=1962978 RepID=UPI002BDA45B7|nr:AsmA family protein [Povalibacter sp.]HMN46218.1 AsmA family protein [Povalibacter sp.]
MSARDPHSVFSRTPRWVWVLAASVAVIAVLIAIWDWNWFKGPVERRVTAATGREFHIRGDLDVDLGWRPRITAQDLHLANADWSKRPEMTSVRQLDLRIALLPLLRGRVQLPYIALDEPKLVLERSDKGVGNWVFETQKDRSSSGSAPQIGQLNVSNGRLEFHEPVLKTDVTLAVRSGKPGRNERAPLLADGKGSWRGHPFELEGRVDSPLDLQDQEKPYRMDVRARAGQTRAHASGALQGQLQIENFDADFALAGANLADLYELLGISLPDTSPYALQGKLDRKGDVWSYRKFSGKVGDSDLSGDASIDIGGERPKLTAALVSQRLDLDDLAGFVGAPPSAKSGETASDAQKQQAAELEAKPTVLPDQPFRLEKLRVMDADVTLKAQAIDAPKLPLEAMDTHLVLENGVLRLDPLDFHAAGGSIASRITLDARETSIQTTLVADVRGLELPKLFPSVEITKKGAGKVSGVAAFTAQGNSIAHMAGSANGDIGLIMGSGHISNLLIELAGLDVAESLKYLLDKDREIPLRCAYADFRIVDGEMTTRGLAFDTTDTVIFGEGDINLRREAFDLRLNPQPKDRSPLTLRTPLKIGGSFKDPSFRPEIGPLAARVGAAAALYSLAPPAALLALIETGPGESIDCGPADGRIEKGEEAAKDRTGE